MTAMERTITTRGALSVVAWIALLVGVIVGFTALGRGLLAGPPLNPAGWAAWAAGRAPELALFALLRLAVLGMAWYLLAVTAVGVLARLTRLRSLVSAADVVTLPAVRRLLHATLGATLAAGSLVGSGAAALAAPAAAPAVEVMTPLPSQPSLVPVIQPATPSPPGAPWVGQQAEPSPPPAAREWRVEPGQSFWSMAEQVLTQAWDRAPTDDEIEPYWRSLVEHNRDALADADNPDLIYPDQVFTVPPPPAPP